MTVVAEERAVDRKRDREHELDRMIASATWKARRAREGRGYRFEIPKKARAA